MWKVRELADKVTNVVMNYTEIEAKVREATNDDHWGPTGAIRHELSTATFSYDYFPEVMGMLWKRIAENKKNPRRIYKSLVLLHHLLLNGSDRVVRSTQDRIYELRSLQDYHVVYEPGFNINTIIPAQEFKDGEVNVRHKSKEIVELVQDEDRLKEERKKSKRNRDKYVGISSDRSMMSGMGSGGGSSGGGRWRDEDEDDEYNNKSNSKYSPPFTRSTKSTFSDSSPSKNSSSPDAGGVDDDADADFNPRATEFGDFKAAAPSPTPTSGNKNIGAVRVPAAKAAATSPASTEFADFQSAFSGASSGAGVAAAPSVAVANPGANSANVDLLGMMDHNTILGTSSTAPAPVVGSFGGFQAAFPQQQQQQQQFVSPAAVQAPSLDLFNNHVQVSSVPVSPMMSQPQQQQIFAQQQQQSLPNLLDNLDLGGGGTGGSAMPPAFAPGLNSMSSDGGGVLKPQNVGNTAANNHINNNNNGTATGANLKGTTWSDLPLSLADVNLSKGPKVAPPKPSMRQMSFNN